MNELFGLFEVLFGIFALSLFANRPLFAANREYKSTQKLLSTKLEIKSKQLLTLSHEVEHFENFFFANGAVDVYISYIAQ